LTSFLLVFSSQVLDGLAFALAIPYGAEQNPLMKGLYETGGIFSVLAVKLTGALLLGLIMAIKWPKYAPALSLLGVVGCISGLLVIPR